MAKKQKIMVSKQLNPFPVSDPITKESARITSKTYDDTVSEIKRFQDAQV